MLRILKNNFFSKYLFCAILLFVVSGMILPNNGFSASPQKQEISQSYQEPDLGEKLAIGNVSASEKDSLMPATPPASTKIASLTENEYDMEKAVLRALKENPNVKAKEFSALAAADGRKSARASFGPVLSTSYGYTKLQHKPTAVGMREQDESYYTAGVSVSQNLFAGLATLSSYQKAALQEESAQADKVKNDIQLILDVQQNFLNLLQARETIRSAKDSLVRLRSQLKVTSAFYDVGLKPRLDVLQAEVDVANAEDLLLRSTQTAETLITRLDTLLNIDIHTTVNYVGSLAKIPFALGLDECLSRAYQQRPDIFIAQKAVEIAGKDVTIASSAFYPQLNAAWSWQTQGDQLMADGSSLNPVSYNRWNVGVQADWNVFEWGKTYYSYRQQKQLASKARAEQASLHNEVAYEIKSKLLQLNEADKRITVSRKGLAQAREAYRMADARYQAQVATITDVLDAQSKLSTAEASYTSALADYEIAVSSLYAAMGERHPDLSSTKY